MTSRLRPIIQPTRKPLPAKDHPSYVELMRWLDTHENLRATFAYATRFRRKNPIDLAFHIPYCGGALRGIPLADMYHAELLDRSEWQTESGDWERDLMEDMVLFQIFHRPGIRTRTILRLNRRLSGFMRERTEMIIEINLFSHLLELRKAERIEEVRPGRWRINPWWSCRSASTHPDAWRPGDRSRCCGSAREGGRHRRASRSPPVHELAQEVVA